MKALVYYGPKKVSVDTVPDAKIEKLTDAVIKLVDAVKATGTLGVVGVFVPQEHELPLDEAPEAYQHFDQRVDGWTKVTLHPHAA